jgi:translation initiation factor 2 gamma subunit (eIF-2gamma)
VELIKTSQAEEQHTQIQNFIAGTAAQNAPIIPVSVLDFFLLLKCKFN